MKKAFCLILKKKRIEMQKITLKKRKVNIISNETSLLNFHGNVFIQY